MEKLAGDCFFLGFMCTWYLRCTIYMDGYADGFDLLFCRCFFLGWNAAGIDQCVLVGDMYGCRMYLLFGILGVLLLVLRYRRVINGKKNFFV